MCEKKMFQVTQHILFIRDSATEPVWSSRYQGCVILLRRYQQMKKEGALNQNIGLFLAISFLPNAPSVTEFDTVSLSLSSFFWLPFKNLSKCINVRCYFGIQEIEKLPERSARIKVKVI